MGNNILVGVPTDDTNAVNSGAAYLFDGSNGALLHTFLSPTPALNDNFGYSVAAVGNNILVGGPADDTNAVNSGAAYLFDGSNGALLRTILNPTPAVGDSFGQSVAAVGNNILVGAFADDAGALDSGAAYLFDGSTGASCVRSSTPRHLPATFLAHPLRLWATTSSWAHSVMTEVPWIPGRRYLFDGTTGALLRTFLNPSPFAGDNFGYSVAAVGNNILVSVPLDDAGAVDSGAAYLFDGTTFDLPTGNGPNDMSLRTNGTILELFDNNTGQSFGTQPFVSGRSVIIAGAANEDDTLTIDFRFGSFGTTPFHFDGGIGGTNRVRVVGDGLSGVYNPSPTTAGDGEVGYGAVRIGFTGARPSRSRA